jgi:hypothetical protein
MATIPLWHLLENQMLNSTNESYKKSIVIDRFHMSNLIRVAGTNVEYIPIRDRYQLVSTPLNELYAGWKSAGNIQVGQTLNVNQQLALGSKQVSVMSKTISLIAGYEIGSVGYRTVFTHGLYPFNTGGVEEIIAAYSTLASNMGSVLVLAPFKAQALTIFEGLTADKTVQTGAKGGTSTGSSNLDTARINAMNMQQRDLGFGLDNTYNDHALIQSMFDVETMQESHQSLFTGHLISLETEGILKHGFLSSDSFGAKSNGASAIGLWLGSAPLAKDSTMVTINANENREVLITEFGVGLDLNIHRDLTVQCLSTTLETQYRIQL